MNDSDVSSNAPSQTSAMPINITPRAKLQFALKFLTLEVSKQLLLIEQGLQSKDASLIKKSRQQVDYIFNAQSQLQNFCTEVLIKHSPINGFSENLTRPSQKLAQKAVPKASTSDALSHTQIQSLQQIGFYLLQFSHQMDQLAKNLVQSQSQRLIRKKPLLEVLDLLKMGVNLIEPAFSSRDTHMATTLCRLKIRIKFFLTQFQKKLEKRLHKSKTLHKILPILHLMTALEQAAKDLLGVGEQLLSAILGQSLKFDQVESLSELLDNLEQQVQLQSLGTTKSGCLISGVSQPNSAKDASMSPPPMNAVIKQGQSEKLAQERAGVEAWHAKFPGIAPHVISYHKKGRQAALLYEYLTGETLESLIQHRKQQALKQALKTLFPLLKEIWIETQINKTHPAHYMKQLKKRLPSVYLTHPEFKKRPIQIGNIKAASLKQLIAQAEKMEKKLTQPKAVYIHGDFNVDNIIFDAVEKKISFIDLHRSRYSDYVQDLSTLTVSCFRMINFSPKTRQLIASTMQQTYDFGVDFAQTLNDDTFEARYALGLARSFISSTRFVLEETHAKEMFYRGQFLLEQLCELKKSELKYYKIPPEILRDNYA